MKIVRHALPLCAFVIALVMTVKWLMPAVATAQRLQQDDAEQKVVVLSGALRDSLARAARGNPAADALSVAMLDDLARQCVPLHDALPGLPSSARAATGLAHFVSAACARFGAAEKHGVLNYAVLGKTAADIAMLMDALARQRSSQQVQSMANWND